MMDGVGGDMIRTTNLIAHFSFTNLGIQEGDL